MSADEPSPEKNVAERKSSSTVSKKLSPPPGLPKPKNPFSGATAIHVENSDNQDSEQSLYERTGMHPFPPPRDSEDDQDQTTPATPYVAPATPYIGPVEWTEPPRVGDDSGSSRSQTPSPSTVPKHRRSRIEGLTYLNWEEGISKDLWAEGMSKDGKRHVELTRHHYNSFLQVLLRFSRNFMPVVDICPALYHLDWVADNPSDPEYRGPRLSAEDRIASRRIEYMLQKAQQQIGEPAFVPTASPHSHWNRILPYGHWITGPDGSADVFVEIQVKRISGRDIEVLHNLGVHHEYAFLGICGGKGLDPAKMSPSSTAEKDSFHAKTLKAYIHRQFPLKWFSESQRRANEAAEYKLKSRVDEDAMFRERVKDSYIYLVRVVAIPNPKDNSLAVNGLTGPAAKHRRATFCAMGGWVAPYTPSQCRRHPQAQRNIAQPIKKSDWTFQAPVALEGDYLPVWDASIEPTLPDVLRMAWQLMAGRRFIGLRLGLGLGGTQVKDDEFFIHLAARIPVLSPSYRY